MTTLRASAHHALATPRQLTVRPITLALTALLIAGALALAVALASSRGDDNPGATKSLRVTPSAPTPPSPAERNQPPGLLGPGMQP